MSRFSQNCWACICSAARLQVFFLFCFVLIGSRSEISFDLPLFTLWAKIVSILKFDNVPNLEKLQPVLFVLYQHCIKLITSCILQALFIIYSFLWFTVDRIHIVHDKISRLTIEKHDSQGFKIVSFVQKMVVMALAIGS